MTHARIRLLALALGLLGSLLLSASTAAAGGTCPDRVIDDWADNARIDGTYPIDCYRAAIQALPEDLRSYSSAADDIRSAMQEQLRSQNGGGSSGSSGSSGSTSGSSAGSDDGRNPQASTGDSEASTQEEGAASASGGGSPPSGQGAEPAGGGDASGGEAAPSASAAKELGDGGASLPTPVIAVLAVVGAAAVALASWLLLRQRRGGSPPGA
jgi:cobalamin biosynthesis Mg chelatase CobN